MTTVKRPALRYHGAKWLLAPWIIGFFSYHECYVEPFCGGASVLLRKPRSWMEVINDLDSNVVTFFRILRTRSEELIRAIELTPFALMEWEQSLLDDPDPLEQARRFYVRSYQGMAGPTAQWRTGWRRQKVVTKSKDKKKMTPAAKSFANISHLQSIVERLRGVSIECAPALEVIARYDSPQTLFYLDPPYVASTRNRWKKSAYLYEMTDEQHTDLAYAIRDIQGMALISGYRGDLYDDLYAGWRRVDKEARTNSKNNTATESLWISPRASEGQLPLFNQ